MKQFLLSTLLLGASLGMSAPSQAQKVTVSPIPQEIVWGEKAFGQNISFKMIGEATADQDAVDVLKGHIQTAADAAVELIVGERGDAVVAEYESLIPEKTEGYYLKVEPNKVIIAGNDSVGTFYGVQSFLQILSQPEVMQVEIKDYPDLTDRGVIEGFYGNPWSKQDRIRQFEFYGANKMNVYIYGPKDDPYHRAQWRVPYPAEKGKEITDLALAAQKNKVQFVWALHPGGDIQWTDADRQKVIDKLESVYALGVRAFAIFFDDISGNGGSGQGQAELLNYVTDHFIKAHPGLPPLIHCPTAYNRAYVGDESYLTAIGQMYPEIRIMWTGNSVVDMINQSDLDWINPRINRNAYIWLNYPVTDYCDRHLLMGPTFGNDNTIASSLAGFTSNPMEYAEASKVSLYSIADYSWNLSDYDANASWERSIPYLMPKYAEQFKVFCENNVDLGSNAHGLRRTEGESVKFKAAKAEYDEAMKDGYNEAAVQKMALQFNTLVWAADELLKADTLAKENQDVSVNTALLDEITPWLQVMRLMGQRGQNIMKMKTMLQKRDSVEFINLYLDCVKKEQEQKEIRSRNFAGSIKSPNPVVADVAVGPFLKTALAECIQEYKKEFNYRTDVFPAVLLEDGTYYIKYNGQYLTNPNPNGTGGSPNYSSTIDAANPQKQEWIISLDYTTERYKIVNAYDQRYINELGNFTTNATTNPYESAWHSYNIYRFNDKYAIQNAGSAGDKYWQSSSSKISPSSNNQLKPEVFIFEIVPVDEALREQHSMIESGSQYYIINAENKYLTNQTPGAGRVGDRPVFADKMPVDVLKKQLWTVNLDNQTNRYNIKSAADKRYVNEKGTFAENANLNPYDATWHTYVLAEMDSLFAIKNAGSAGDKFWTISGKNIEMGGTSISGSYLFKFVQAESLPSGMGSLQEDASVSYQLNGNRLLVTANSAIEYISLFSLDGKVVAEVKGKNVLECNGRLHGNYVLAVKTESGMKIFKVLLN